MGSLCKASSSNQSLRHPRSYLHWQYVFPLPIPICTTHINVITVNDISDSSKYKFPRLNTTDFPSFYNAIISTEFEAIETLYQAGYKNYLFMNLPPLDRTVCPPSPPLCLFLTIQPN